jgi:hypothetical protein
MDRALGIARLAYRERAVSRQPKPLVQFDATYYVYPTSVSRGFWSRYPLEEGLSTNERAEREKWLRQVQSQSRSEFHKVVNDHFANATDQDTLCSALSEHGVFSERFFHGSLHERITRQVAKSLIGLYELQRLIASAWGHKLRLYSKSDAIFHITDHLFQQNLFHAISHPQVHRQLQVWFEEFSKPTICALCGNSFRVIDLPDWIYFGSNGFKRCCFRCRIVETPKKSDLRSLVPALTGACGFIPNSNASAINYAFTSRLPTIEWAKVMLAYAKMGGIEHVKKKFGSWFTALAETGALPDGVLATARGIRCIARDGHTCFSLDEQRIDDWLHAHDLDHEREPIYPQHPSLNPTGKRRADWKVHETFVEYFGLVGDTEYEKKMDEKMLLAQEVNISLIAIYPSDIERLDKRLGYLLH